MWSRRERGSLHTETAPAKLNLGIKVLGARDDGFHEIRSIVQTVSLRDRLTFESAPSFTLSCSDPSLSTGSDNLVMGAVALFRRRLEVAGGQCEPLHIHLDKVIPRGAGLGGGSSDCAATLRGLNYLCGKPFDAPNMHAMGMELGSDVPFLLTGGTALAEGRGEIILPLEPLNRGLCCVLVCPEVEISTAWAYGQLQLPPLTPHSPYHTFTHSISGGRVDVDSLWDLLENDFQRDVERAEPIVAQAVDAVRQTGARACSMSGTGSTVYGIYDDRNIASEALATVKASGFRSFFCDLVEGLV